MSIASVASQRMLLLALGLLVVVGIVFWGFSSKTSLPLPHHALSAFSPGSGARARTEDIHNATLGFGKIFAISLKTRTDHRDALTLASAVSGFNVDYIDGVAGDTVSDKVLPADSVREKLGAGNIGSWRAHMDAVHAVIAGNYSTALIVEDDIDWSVDIKKQLSEFAAGSRALTQPLAGAAPNVAYADPTFLSHDATWDPITLDAAAPPKTLDPLVSPYGDNWDIMWLGHCGARMPSPELDSAKGRYIISDDATVPASQHRHSLNETDKDLYAEHTRVIHHAMGPICTFAYAVSQRGARKIMHRIGLKSFGGPFDNILADFCDRNTCLTTQPELFHHWRKAGYTAADSDITDWGAGGKGEFREKGRSQHIRYSVRLNLEKLIAGKPDLEDQYPDDAPAIP